MIFVTDGPSALAALATAAVEVRPIHSVERDLFQTTHAEVGAYLLGTWGLPFSSIETVAYHHQPDAVPGSSSRLLAAVHLADAVVNSQPGGPAASFDRRRSAVPGRERVAGRPVGVAIPGAGGGCGVIPRQPQARRPVDGSCADSNKAAAGRRGKL